MFSVNFKGKTCLSHFLGDSRLTWFRIFPFWSTGKLKEILLLNYLSLKALNQYQKIRSAVKSANAYRELLPKIRFAKAKEHFAFRLDNNCKFEIYLN